MSSIYEKIDNRIETFLSTLKRFPLASFSALLITMIFLVLIDTNHYNSPNVIMAYKIAFVATLGVVLFPALQLLGRSSIFSLLGLIILSIYYYCLPHNLDNANETLFIRHLLLGIALFFMIIWVPFIGRKSDNDTFWEYAQSIIFGIIIAILFSVIIYQALAIALYAIEKLFHFEVESIRYAQLALIVFGVFGVNFFLSQIPKHPLFLHVKPYSKIKRIFSKNILAPIAIIYFIILFAYTAKILINMTYPSGTLSWVIVAFSFVAIVSFLFLSPYLKKSSLSQRFIWLAIFLQTIMLGFALWIRVEEYGITYNRYLLAMFGLWLGVMSLYFIFFGKAQQKWLFFFASLLIVASQFGSYSATNMSKKSQTKRLVQLISTAVPRSEELDMKRKYEISDGLAYMEEHYELDTFKKVIPHILKKYKIANTKQDFASYATQALGFKFIDKWQWLEYQSNHGEQRKEKHYFYANNLKNSIKIQGYTHLINYRYNYNTSTNQEDYVNDDLNLSISFKNNQLQVKQAKNNLHILDLNDYVDKLIKQNASSNTDQEALTHEGNHIKILFKTLSIYDDDNITDFEGQILLKN
ncbi:MAG: Unknown protein [uncultured Sulfurovum sp.]|uniref:DUF4153 domain-containing protein n=1 Tax=uncultured Sulfurovum sp. TaxID=269237 RepID=A0A6S6T835_9BACT|nr:MAG: Unknown protein [uncultured Sulfurovum sp.]